MTTEINQDIGYDAELDDVDPAHAADEFATWTAEDKLEYVFQFVVGLSQTVEALEPMLNEVMPMIQGLMSNPMIQGFVQMSLPAADDD